MKSILASLCMTHLGLANVSANLVIDTTDKLIPRNATHEHPARGVAAGVYDINPSPYGAPCGMTWTVTITVDNAGDQSHASPLCKYLHSVFDHPTGNGITSKEYNFIYLCPPQWAEPTSGYRTENTKLIVTGPTSFPGVLQSFGANLNIRETLGSPPVDINIPVNIGYFYDDENPSKLGFKFLTFKNIQCAAVTESLCRRSNPGDQTRHQSERNVPVLSLE